MSRSIIPHLGEAAQQQVRKAFLAQVGHLAEAKKRERPEQKFQQQVAQFLSVALPEKCFWSAIGHGGGGKVRGAILKSMGLKAGIPDIIIIYRGYFFGIELKAGKGVLSQAQKDTHQEITKAGGVVAPCKSLGDVADFLALVGIPLRASFT